MSEVTKKFLRSSISEKVNSISREEIAKKSKRICNRVFSCTEYQKASAVMLYLPLAQEVDVLAIISDCWKNGKSVLIPQILWDKKQIIPVRIENLDDNIETTNWNGLKNPTSGKAFACENIDLIITPGLGFDFDGNRLGRGGAYYDNFFASENLKAFRLAVAFSEQIVEEISTEKHDQKIDGLITDEVMEYFSK